MSGKLMLLLACLSLPAACSAPYAPGYQEQEKTGYASTSKDSAPCWIDLQTGELPPYNFYDALDSMLRKYDRLCYRRIERYGCEPDTPATLLQQRYELQNRQYFRNMEAVYGRDWKQQFDTELEALQVLLATENIHIKPGGIVCNDLNGHEEGTPEKCTYKGRTLLQAWQEYKRANKDTDPGIFLTDAPPASAHSIAVDTQVNAEHYTLTVNYHIQSRKNIIVELEYPGGVTTLQFAETKTGTDIITTGHPD